MNKDYLESLERLAMPDELHIKECEKLGIGLTEDFDIVEHALLELKAIKEANPGEAMKCLNILHNALDKYLKTPVSEYVNLFDCINTIKQALLKAQESKQYLKWEDLVFTVDWKVMTVKMGDTIYKILYRYCYANEEVQLLSEDKKVLCLRLIGRYKYNIQLFNDSHLERVKEE